MRLGWDFRITGYAGARHPKGIPQGTMLLQTTHKGISSAQIEIMVWQGRMRRGEVSKVELVDLRPYNERGRNLTNMMVLEHTVIPWYE